MPKDVLLETAQRFVDESVVQGQVHWGKLERKIEAGAEIAKKELSPRIREIRGHAIGELYTRELTNRAYAYIGLTAKDASSQAEKIYTCTQNGQSIGEIKPSLSPKAQGIVCAKSPISLK